MEWVEKGAAPDRLIATGETAAGVRSRPLCPYPAIAVYDGKGDQDRAESFACATPEIQHEEPGR